MDCLGLLAGLAAHDLPVVRAPAVWAVHVLAGGEEAGRLLAGARSGETDAAVLAEYAQDGGGLPAISSGKVRPSAG